MSFRCGYVSRDLEYRGDRRRPCLSFLLVTMLQGVEGAPQALKTAGTPPLTDFTPINQNIPTFQLQRLVKFFLRLILDIPIPDRDRSRTASPCPCSLLVVSYGSKRLP